MIGLKVLQPDLATLGGVYTGAGVSLGVQHHQPCSKADQGPGARLDSGAMATYSVGR